MRCGASAPVPHLIRALLVDVPVDDRQQAGLQVQGPHQAIPGQGGKRLCCLNLRRNMAAAGVWAPVMAEAGSECSGARNAGVKPLPGNTTCKFWWRALWRELLLMVSVVLPKVRRCSVSQGCHGCVCTPWPEGCSPVSLFPSLKAPCTTANATAQPAACVAAPMATAACTQRPAPVPGHPAC